MEQKQLKQDEVHFGALVGKAKTVELVYSGKNGTLWQGIGSFKDHVQMPIYFQLMESRELFIQCLSLLIAKYLNVPSPQVGLIAVHPTQFPVKVTTISTLALATMRSKHPCLLRHVNQFENSDPIHDLIMKWSDLASAAALDEWLCVSSRDANSYLIDGNADIFLNAFPGAIPENFKADGYVINSLLLMLELKDNSEIGKARTKKTLQKSASSFHTTPLYELVESMKTEIYQGDKYSAKVVDFLESRINKLADLLETAINTSQTSLRF